ncbi:MAG: hypothetical protein JRF63_14700 [Deltaproteobacteria bacterium]|nr:hypothetical protein [Deltaproteobacteria bacterium]
MKRWIIASLMLAATACGGEDAQKTGPDEKPADEATGEKPADEAADKATEDEAAEGTPSDPRLAALEAEYALYDAKQLSQDASTLSDGEKQMLRHLLKAAEIIEELHMLQIHPKNLEWKKRVDDSGAEIEQKLFARYQTPWCQDDDSPECCALPEKPARELGRYHWPADLTDDEFAVLGKQINGKELLSPFTIVRRNDHGGFDAIPYAKDELLGPRMKLVAAELRAAAETAPDPSLKKFLLSRADAFEKDDAFPYDTSDFDWIAMKGDWEVTVGPYETYKNPRQLKALFEMYIAHEDKGITAELAQFKKSLQEMENALGELVGPEIYQSRKLDPRISIRAAEAWMAAGDGRRGKGAIVAFHLPNRGESVDAGLYKKVMLVNHSLAFEGVSKARAEQVLDKDQLQYVDAHADIKNVTFHEFAHGFGAYHEMKVKNPKGKMTTVKQALKEYDSLLEEEKADTFGMWLLSYQKQRGWVDEQEEKQRYTSGFMHVLGLLQYQLDGTYPRMVAIQLGWYLDAGAVTWDSNTGRFTIHYDKMPAAVESLAKHVATIQLTGDHDKAVDLVEKYITHKGGKDYELKGVLGEARKVMLDKFKAAEIRSPALTYEVTGL